MIHTLIGSNSYVLQSAFLKLKNVFIAECGDLAVESIDVSEWSVSKILDTVGAQPFLTPKRMVIVHGLAANKSASEKIDAIIAAVSEATEVIIVEPKIDKRSVLYKTLKKQTALTEYAEIDARDAPKWLVQEAKHLGGTLSLQNATYLVARVGAGQQLLASELAKLLQYSPEVTRETIDMLTEQAPLSSVFELIEASFKGNMQRALQLYEDQRAQNVEALAIEALFVWQLHVIAVIKAARGAGADAIAAQSGISPYVVKKSMALADMRTFSEIKSYVASLAQAEYDMKTKSVDTDEVMKNYIVRLGQ